MTWRARRHHNQLNKRGAGKATAMSNIVISAQTRARREPQHEDLAKVSSIKT
jgi:hypothetical protein